MNFDEWCDASLELWWLGREATPQEREMAEAAWNAAIESTKTTPSQEPNFIPVDGLSYAIPMPSPDAAAQIAELKGLVDYWKGAQRMGYEKIKERDEQIANLTKQRDDLLAALEKLARLGNGDQYGNSDGNMIARAAIAKVKQ